MQCRRCGKELGNSEHCNFCGYDNVEGNVREMTNTEKNFYDGVTIETGTTDEQNYSGYHSHKNNYRNSGYKSSRRTFYTTSGLSIFSRLFGKLFTGLSSNGLIAKIAVTLIVVAISVITFFVAVPILFFLLALGLALFILSLLGR